MTKNTNHSILAICPKVYCLKFSVKSNHSQILVVCDNLLAYFKNMLYINQWIYSCGFAQEDLFCTDLKIGPLKMGEYSRFNTSIQSVMTFVNMLLLWYQMSFFKWHMPKLKCDYARISFAS